MFYVVKRNTFLISEIRFTYKFVIPDTKTKQNIFLKFLKYWPNSHDFNKLVIKAKMHPKIYFLKFSLLYENTIWFLALRNLTVCMKQIFFLMFWWKPGILIPNLYFYDIKIQINIKQNLVEKYTKELQFQNKNFFLIFSFPFLGPDPAI